MANYKTYNDIITDVLDKFSETSAVFGDETQTSARRFITQKEFEIYSARKWPFMQKQGTITTVASTGSYVLATDYSYGSIYDVIDSTNQQRITRVQARDIDTNYAGLTTTGNPTFYYLDGYGDQTTTLTGSIDPAASTTVTGVGTLFLTELEVGDRITVTGETRIVTAIASNTSLTVNTAFSNNANDTSPDKVVSNVQKIGFYPLPSDAFTITYRYFRDPIPTDISTNANNDYVEPILPRRYRGMLVDAVLEELLQKDTNALADRVNAKFQIMLNRMIQDYSGDYDYTPKRRSSDEIVTSFSPARLPNNFPQS